MNNNLFCNYYKINFITIFSLCIIVSVYLAAYHIRNVQLTSGAMNVYIAQNAQVGQDLPCSSLNTGDNFYYCGIQITRDSVLLRRITMCEIYEVYGVRSIQIFHRIHL
jgi:hypothetical protein